MTSTGEESTEAVEASTGGESTEAVEASTGDTEEGVDVTDTIDEDVVPQKKTITVINWKWNN